MRHGCKQWVLGSILALLAIVAMPYAAYADCNKDPNKPVCTCFSDLEPKLDAGEQYILSNVSSFIQDVISTASEDLFYSFTDSSAYQGALIAAATLMIIFYAIAFMIGVVQGTSFAQALKRLVLLGLIFTAVSPTGFDFFSNYVVRFFNEGTDELIGGVMEISTGIPYVLGDSPFIAIDGIANYVISPDMIIAVLGTFLSGGPFGLAMGVILGAAVLAMIKLLIEALRVYAVSYILRALLLGVAPIFFAFMLFEKTKPLFNSWVSALVNLSLQPILFFTFLSFFIVLISSSTRDILGGQELCWVEYQNVQGSAVKRSAWRFTSTVDNVPNVSENDWQGAIACKLAKGSDCKESDLNIIDLLIFLLLVYVGSKFGAVVNDIAQDIAGASVTLGPEMQMPSWGKGGGGGAAIQQNAAKAAARPTAGGR